MVSPEEHRNILAEEGIEAIKKGNYLVILTVRSWLSAHTLFPCPDETEVLKTFSFR